MDSVLQESKTLPRKSVIVGGIAAGVISGLVMALVAMFKSADQGLGIWHHIDSIAAIFWGERAFGGGVFVILVGWVLHLATSAMLGLVFSLLFSRQLTSAGSLLGTTLLYGAAVWAFMTYGALPVFHPLMRETMYELMPEWWFALHVVFGLGLSLSPVFERVWLHRLERQSKVRRTVTTKRAA